MTLNDMKLPAIGSRWKLNHKRDLAPFQYTLRYEVIGVSELSIVVQTVETFPIVSTSWAYTLDEFYTLLEPANG